MPPFQTAVFGEGCRSRLADLSDPLLEVPWRMRGKAFLLGFGLLVLVLAAYSPIADAGAIWDDDSYLSDNSLLRSPRGLALIWAAPLASPQYYPVAFTSFWLEYRVWGLNYPAYHVVNVFLHGVNAILVWRVLKRLKLRAAWAAAAIFALHPVQIESVAWIAERKNVLSTFFYLWALLAYLAWVSLRGAATSATDACPAIDGKHAPGRRCGWYLLALACYLAALGSKTVSCSLPAAIILIIWWKRGSLRVSDAVSLSPFFAAGLIAGLSTAWIETHHVGARGSQWSFSAVERCLIAGRALWFYAGKLACPANLMFIYPRWRIDASDWRQYVAPLAALGVLAGLWLLRGRIGRGPFVAVAFFCGTLVPALGFFNVYPMRYSFVADHFQYLASLGLIALATVVGDTVLGFRVLPPWSRGVVCTGVLFALGTMTLIRTPAFVSSRSIWQDTLAKNPTSLIANNNLGQCYRDRRDFKRALPYFEAALRVDPGCTEARYNLGATLAQLGDLAGAERELTRALELDPSYWRARFALGLLRERQGRRVEAAECFRAILRDNPGHTEARKQLERVEGSTRLNLRPGHGSSSRE